MEQRGFESHTNTRYFIFWLCYRFYNNGPELFAIHATILLEVPKIVNKFNKFPSQLGGTFIKTYTKLWQLPLFQNNKTFSANVLEICRLDITVRKKNKNTERSQKSRADHQQLDFRGLKWFWVEFFSFKDFNYEGASVWPQSAAGWRRRRKRGRQPWSIHSGKSLHVVCVRFGMLGGNHQKEKPELCQEHVKVHPAVLSPRPRVCVCVLSLGPTSPEVL